MAAAAVTGGVAAAARIPAALMAGCVALIALGSAGPGRDPRIAAAAVLAVLVLARLRLARVLLFLLAVGAIGYSFTAPAPGSPVGVARLACCAVAIVLLAGPPVTAHIRRDQAAPGWPAPRPWVVLASIGAGLLLTLAPEHDVPRAMPSCPPGATVTVPVRDQCQAAGSGYPAPWVFTGPVQYGPGLGQGKWLGVGLTHDWQPRALVTDWADGSIAVLTLLYLIGLGGLRDPAGSRPGPEQPPEPGPHPAGPEPAPEPESRRVPA